MQNTARGDARRAGPGNDLSDVIGRHDVESRNVKTVGQPQCASSGKKFAQVIEHLEMNDSSAERVADDHARSVNGQGHTCLLYTSRCV